jgi:hypothetical protein
VADQPFVAPDSVFIEANPERAEVLDHRTWIAPPRRIAPVLADLHELFRLPAEAADLVRHHAAGLNLRCRPATVVERDDHVLEMLDLIRSPRIERSMDENRAAWEHGWQQNLDEARAGGFAPDTLKPKYFRGHRCLRWQRGLVVSENPQIEYDLFVLARRLLFGWYLPGIHTIYEIGSGSGNNLWLLSEMFPGARIVGLDWVDPAVKLANELGKATGRRIEGRRFNMLSAAHSVTLEPGSAVVTIHALEQLGDQHGGLLDWLAAARPAVVLHYEPIVEFYDAANLLDYLALWYSERRRYLSGFWTAIAARRDAGQLEVLAADRPGVGGVYHEASVIVWRPTLG